MRGLLNRRALEPPVNAVAGALFILFKGRGAVAQFRRSTTLRKVRRESILI